MKQELQKIEFNDDQVGLIKRTIAKDATDDELKLFIYQCNRTGLDPMTRQIYFMKRAGKVTIQTSIDGFRVIAERSGTYAGQGEPQFIEENGVLKCCKVSVYRFSPNGQRYEASVGVAYWNEYCPPSGQDFMWKKMPHTMLSKVAEALALRKSYPQDLSGLYTNDEMAQADKEDKIIEPDFSDVPDKSEKELLRKLVYNSDLEGEEKLLAFEAIDTCNNFTMYAKIQHRLEARQLPIDQIPNPNQSDISKHIKSFA